MPRGVGSVPKVGIVLGAVVLAVFGSGSSAFAYISNRLFFQYERAKSDRAHALAHPQGQGVLESHSSPYKVTRSGAPLKVHYYYSLMPDCTSQGRTTANLVSAPQSGQITTSVGREFPAYPTTNTHSVCNTRRVASTDVFYRSAADFVGTDRFTVEVVFPNGVARQDSYVVSVR